MNYFRFFQANRALLGFGILTALSTSFGQTFFVSLFLLHVQSSFQVSNSEFGWLYACSTLISALLLPRVGGRIDSADLGRYTTATMVGLAASALFVGLSVNWWMLGAGLLGLRLFGQGLLGHISQTVMAREFGASRGRALGVAGIGYPLGEAAFPVICAFLLRFLPWRVVWIVCAATIGVILLPVGRKLLRERRSSRLPEADSGSGAGESGAAVQIWSDAKLYLVMPSVLVLPFVLTGLFLYQAVLAQSKGWAPELMAGAFAAFAITRAIASLAAGPDIDRFTASRLLPIYLAPLGPV